MRILFFLMKKKIKNQSTDTRAYAVGEEVEPVAGAPWDDCLLYDFGEAAVGDTDDDGQPNSTFSVSYSVVYELFTIAP